MSDLSVLQLVTAEEVFFRQQIEVLEEKGVDCDVCVVPGGEQVDGAMAEKRGIKEYLQYFPKVRRYLRNGDYDLIHANYGLTAPYAITQFKLPVVLTLWGSDVVGFDGMVTKACAWRCDAITVRSEEMRELLGREDAFIVPSGVDMERFRPIDRVTARQEINWDVDGTIILFPYSPNYERKNYLLAEQVVNEAKRELDRNMHLKTISGVPHERMPYYINAADALLLTSKHEGSPNTVKEAMACNIPVVSTDVGDVKNRLYRTRLGGVGQTTSELVDLLISVIEENDNRSNGRIHTSELSWDSIAEELIEIYYKVIDK